jgi:hypothetical protein
MAGPIAMNVLEASVSGLGPDEQVVLILTVSLKTSVFRTIVPGSMSNAEVVELLEQSLEWMRLAPPRGAGERPGGSGKDRHR